RRRAFAGADGRARQENAGWPASAGNARRGRSRTAARNAEIAAEHAGQIPELARSRRRKIPRTAGLARRREEEVTTFLSIVIPGRRAAASPESTLRSTAGYGFRLSLAAQARPE